MFLVFLNVNFILNAFRCSNSDICSQKTAFILPPPEQGFDQESQQLQIEPPNSHGTGVNYRYQKAPASEQDINACLRPNYFDNKSNSDQQPSARSFNSQSFQAHQAEQHTSRSAHSNNFLNHNGYPQTARSMHSNQCNTQNDYNCNGGLHTSLSQLALNDAADATESSMGLSARSRQTDRISNSSKKRSTGSIHKLGSKLPLLK